MKKPKIVVFKEAESSWRIMEEGEGYHFNHGRASTWDLAMAQVRWILQHLKTA